jgi:hypothetical protein
MDVKSPLDSEITGFPLDGKKENLAVWFALSIDTIGVIPGFSSDPTKETESMVRLELENLSGTVRDMILTVLLANVTGTTAWFPGIASTAPTWISAAEAPATAVQTRKAKTIALKVKCFTVLFISPTLSA